jgi:hypothetical protein
MHWPGISTHHVIRRIERRYCEVEGRTSNNISLSTDRKMSGSWLTATDTATTAPGRDCHAGQHQEGKDVPD